MAQLFVQRHGCSRSSSLRLKKNASAPAPANTLRAGGAGGRLLDNRPGGLRVLLDVQSARRHLLRAARQAGGGDLHDTLRGDGQEHRPRAGHCSTTLHQGPAPDQAAVPCPSSRPGPRSPTSRPWPILLEERESARFRRNRDAVQWVHEKSPSLPLAMGRLDAHAGYNSGALGRARRLLEVCSAPKAGPWNIPAPALVPTPLPSMSSNEKDTVDSISQRYGVSSQTIIDRNKLKAPHYAEGRPVYRAAGRPLRRRQHRRRHPGRRGHDAWPGQAGQPARRRRAQERARRAQDGRGPADAAQPGRRGASKTEATVACHPPPPRMALALHGKVLVPYGTPGRPEERRHRHPGAPPATR